MKSIILVFDNNVIEFLKLAISKIRIIIRV